MFTPRRESSEVRTGSLRRRRATLSLFYQILRNWRSATRESSEVRTGSLRQRRATLSLFDQILRNWRSATSGHSQCCRHAREGASAHLKAGLSGISTAKIPAGMAAESKKNCKPMTMQRSRRALLYEIRPFRPAGISWTCLRNIPDRATHRAAQTNRLPAWLARVSPLLAPLS